MGYLPVFLRSGGACTIPETAGSFHGEQTAESGDLGDLADLVKPRVALQKDVPALVEGLRKVAFTGDADADAQAIAKALTIEGSAG